MTGLSSEPVKLLVIDLDNTLYDWVGSFVPAFYAMAGEAAAILGVDFAALLDGLRAVHQRHGSSEHPFALLETDLVRSRLSGLSEAGRRAALDPAFHRFNSVRKNTLSLYDGVIETLQTVVDRGIAVVAYTDARIPNSLYRVNRLGIDRFIVHLYAPNARFPQSPDQDAKPDLLRVLPEDDKKPNPRTLLDICRDLGVAPQQTLYVGDSLTRDIFMANRAGIRSAWARYGTLVDPSLWEQLVRVSHWTAADVEAELRLKAEAAVAEPDIVLDCFADLLQHLLPETSRLANRA